MNKPGMHLLSIGEAAAALGVAVATLRRWHRQGRLLPALRTSGGHRRCASETIRHEVGFSHVEVVTDLGSGLNYRKKTPGISRKQLTEILTVFSSRLYGSRSRKNLKALAG